MHARAMLFDFGQTLVDSADGFRAAEAIAKQNLFTDLFSQPCNPGSWETFLDVYRRIRGRFHARSRFSRYDIWQAVYDHFGKRPQSGRLGQWESQYWSLVKDRTRPFPETLAVLETLSRRLPLGMITNTQGQQNQDDHRIALFPEIEHFFTCIIVAGEAGIPSKPDPAAFRAGLECLDIAPRQAVFVGDDWRIDVCGAMDAGLRAVWLKHRLVKRSWPEVETAADVIDSLEGLLLFNYGDDTH